MKFTCRSKRCIEGEVFELFAGLSASTMQISRQVITTKFQFLTTQSRLLMSQRSGIYTSGRAGFVATLKKLCE
jgi:hypothetical protein